MVHYLEPANNPFLVDCLALRTKGLSIRKIAKAHRVPYSRVQRVLARYEALETNGAPSAAQSAPTATLSQERDDSSGYTPECTECTALAALERRVCVLESFITALQRQALPVNGAPSVPNGAPTIKRGFVLAASLSAEIDAYAQAHHCQVKGILDTALREFFAGRGWPAAEIHQ